MKAFLYTFYIQIIGNATSQRAVAEFTFTSRNSPCFTTTIKTSINHCNCATRSIIICDLTI